MTIDAEWTAKRERFLSRIGWHRHDREQASKLGWWIFVGVGNRLSIVTNDGTEPSTELLATINHMAQAGDKTCRKAIKIIRENRL